MYQLDLAGKVIESTNLSTITSAILLDNFERYPELANRPGLKDRLGKSPAKILHDGHSLMGCDVCIHDLRQPFHPYGGDQ